MTKVWVKFFGGLGNQLFQYAAGRALANRLSAELSLDIAHFEVKAKERRSRQSIQMDETLRDYELCEAFGIQTLTYKITAIAFARIQLVLPNREHRSLLARLRRKLLYKFYSFIEQRVCSSYTHFREPHYHYTPHWEKLSGNVYLDGYWQSERYFKQITSELRRELSLDRFESKRTAAVLSKIKKPCSVSVHFRRSDYIELSRQLPLCYYTRALEIIRKLVGEKLCLYIFCDDVEELKTLLPEVVKDLPYELVSVQGYSSYEEMMLMSRCQHHIMANSTYSWWGTWLHDRSADDRPGEKYVIAPRIWIPEGGYGATHKNVKDLYCDGWILI